MRHRGKDLMQYRHVCPRERKMEITRRGSASTDYVESLCGGPQVLFNKGCGSGQPKISSIDARYQLSASRT